MKIAAVIRDLKAIFGDSQSATKKVMRRSTPRLDLVLEREGNNVNQVNIWVTNISVPEFLKHNVERYDAGRARHSNTYSKTRTLGRGQPVLKLKLTCEKDLCDSLNWLKNKR
jgi:hypothetical protein